MNAENSIWKLLSDLSKKKGITEIIINDPDHVYIERDGELVRLNVEIQPEDFPDFCRYIAKYNKSEYNENNPIVDGNLPDGSRINIISGIYTNKNPAITIRKYLHSIKYFDDFDGIFGLSNRFVDLIKAMVKSKMNIVVSGGTGVGKTTFLNLLLQEASPLDRVVTIEDTRELNFHLPNKVSLVAAKNRSRISEPLTMRDLLKNALRMRPDRIIVGEIRGAESFDMLQSMNTGHDGSMCTVHSNSCAECLSRIENLFMYNGIDIPVKVIRNQMCSAIDFIIQLERDRDGNRLVAQIAEVSNMEGDTILLQDIGRLDEGKLKFTGLVPKRLNDLVSDGGLDRNFFRNV
jgi:pilus assembly protein CpaF